MKSVCSRLNFRKSFQILSVTAIALGVMSCAEPAKITEMSTGKRITDATLSDPALAKSICVELVDGGKKTNPLWVSEVDNASFLKALEKSLAANGFLIERPQDCRYGITAHLLGLSQPFIGVDVEVRANVNYSVRQAGTETPYLLKTTTTAYTARFTADAILWGQRLQAANEGAIRKNIGKLIDALLAAQPPAASS